MILIGQYDSPFVRRVAIAAALYDLAFEHRPWSTFGDAERIRPYNPLLRVPTRSGTTAASSSTARRSSTTSISKYQRTER